MVRTGAPVATVNFRRQIKFFLAALVGFLSVIVLTLLILLVRTNQQLEATTITQWNAVASAAASSLPPENVPPKDRLEQVRLEHFLAGLRVQPAMGAEVTVGSTSGANMHTITRSNGTYLVHVVFDAAPLRATQSRMTWIVAIVFAATLLGTALLLLFLPQIINPIEQLLEQAKRVTGDEVAGDEANYLINTFRQTIETLQDQELELRRLREIDQARASDLELITSTLTRSLSSGFIALDERGLLFDINAAAEFILDIADGRSLLGKRPSEAFGASAFADAIERSFESKTSLVREEITDGVRTIGVTAVPLLSENDRHLGQIVLFSDLTHVRSLEKQLREMQTLADIGEISAGIAHEFRNSLATITGYLRLAGREDGDTRRRIDSALAEALQLADAVERLLAFARPIEITTRPIDARELIEQTLARLASQLEGIEVNVRGELTFAADPSLLSRAIENILRNAIASIRQQGAAGRLDVELTQEPPTIRVSDNGVGLKEEDAQRLMLPFQSDRADGFGLGLPLTKKIVTLHGGTIRLTGTPGEGATVEIAFDSARDGAAA